MPAIIQYNVVVAEVFHPRLDERVSHRTDLPIKAVVDTTRPWVSKKKKKLVGGEEGKETELGNKRKMRGQQRSLTYPTEHQVCQPIGGFCITPLLYAAVLRTKKSRAIADFM